MKNYFLICLLVFFSFDAFAGLRPLPMLSPFHHRLLPVSYAVTNKTVVLYIPNSCSGMINDAVAGEGELAVYVQGKIHNGQLSVQVKVAYKGNAITTVEGTAYRVNSNMAAAETRIMSLEPVDLFLKGSFKLEGKNNDESLYINDIGYLTIYPDGTVADHLFDPRNNPAYSCPKVYCTAPNE